MKRIFLLFVIIGMCILVAIGGTMIFVNSDSTLKRNNAIQSMSELKDISLFVDVVDNKIYVLSEGKVVKTYPISSGKYRSPSPIGEWAIVSKDTWGEGFGGRWMGFNVPWGKYGIHGTKEPWTIGSPGSHGCIRMYNNHVAELYKIVPYGTKVKIYGGPFGAFGQGLRVLKPGFRGADVYEIQRILKDKGYYYGYVNGIYNSAMRDAIHRFQKKNHLYISNTIGKEFYDKLDLKLFD